MYSFTQYSDDGTMQRCAECRPPRSELRDIPISVLEAPPLEIQTDVDLSDLVVDICDPDGPNYSPQLCNNNAVACEGGVDCQTAQESGDVRSGVGTPANSEGGSSNITAQTPEESQPEGSSTPESGDHFSTLNQRIRQLEHQYEEQCQPMRADAELCCGEPTQCIGRPLGLDNQQSDMGAQMLQMVMGTMAMTAQQSAQMGIASACGKMEKIGYITAAMNAAMAGRCSRAVRACDNSCEQIKSEANSLKEQLEREHDQVHVNASYAAEREYERNQDKLQSLISQATRSIRECSIANNGTTRAAMQAIAAAQSAKLAGICEEQTTAENQVETVEEALFNVDCAAPGAAANPVCQQQCSRPGAQSLPMCQAFLDNNPQFQLPNLGDGLVQNNGLGGDSEFDLGDLTEDEQDAEFQVFDPTGSGLATATGSAGGGGGGLSGGGGGGGDFGAGAGGSGGMLDLNSKILRGLSSGRGYTSSAGGTRSGGGFRGYASGSRKPASKGKKFSLKDYLPGGKKAKSRGLASALGNPEIGAKTDNIFKRISNRFYQVCMKDRLYDCASVRANHKKN